MKEKRHIGKITNTDQRCVVVFMQIPGREDHALVAPTDNLPARHEQALMDILESNEGQAEETLANVLHRRLMPDTGKSVLQTLHEQNFLVAVPVSSIIMYPRPNMPFALAQILEGMGRLVTPAPAIDPASVADAYLGSGDKFNPHAHNAKSNSVEQHAAMARNLLFEAADLETVARIKREQAYRLAPDLAPAPPNEAPAPTTNGATASDAASAAVTPEPAVIAATRPPGRPRKVAR